MESKKYIMVACAVLAKECQLCASKSKTPIDIVIVEQGLHDVGEEKMSAALQEKINAIDHSQYEAILLAYGLCNNGVRNLTASIPIVIPRAHDCIALLMGSRKDYSDYFKSHPGTFFLSAGWIEEGKDSLNNPMSTTRQLGMATREEYVEKHGEDNADYLMQTLNDHLKNYSHVAYIDTGIPNTEELESKAIEWAREKEWGFSHVDGNTTLIARLMDGDWDDSDYLVIKPGQTIEPSHDDMVVKAV